MKRPKLSRHALHLKRMDEQRTASRERRMKRERAVFDEFAERVRAAQVGPMMMDSRGYYWIW